MEKQHKKRDAHHVHLFLIYASDGTATRCVLMHKFVQPIAHRKLVLLGTHLLNRGFCVPERSLTKKEMYTMYTSFKFMRVMGLEPIRHKHTPLKRACLPVPAHSLTNINYYSTEVWRCQEKNRKKLKKFYYFSIKSKNSCELLPLGRL